MTLMAISLYTRHGSKTTTTQDASAKTCNSKYSSLVCVWLARAILERLRACCRSEKRLINFHRSLFIHSMGN